jgi:hypothetical protein
MSVLIEAVTLVVRRRQFDALYPGGAVAFLRSVRELTSPPRFACSDDPHLLNLSFDSVEHAAPAMGLLRLAGLRGLENSIPQAVDYALIDQDFTPLPGYSWLAWSKHEDGFTFAWDPAQEVGPVAGPAEWMRTRSASGERGVVGDESDHLLLLASENGVRTYLDFRSGTVSQVDATNSSSARPSTAPDEEGRWGERYTPAAEDVRYGGPLCHLLCVALDELEWKLTGFCPPSFVVELTSQLATYRCIYSVANDPSVISCSVCAPLIIARKDRRRVLDFITRANFGLPLGAFELCLDTGVLRFRAGIALGEEFPSPALVGDVARVGVAALDRYFPRILEVIAGERSVIEAVSLPPDQLG